MPGQMEDDIPAVLKRPQPKKETTVMPENSIEGRAEPFLKRVENLMDDLASERGKYMAACKPIHADIKTVYAEAKDEEVPTKPLKQLVKRRELSRKQAKLDEEMKGEEGEYDYEMLVAALGDLAELPLGQAALGLDGADDGDDVRPRFKQTEDEAPKKRGRKPRSPAVEHARSMNGESPEEVAALDEIEREGLAGAVSA